MRDFNDFLIFCQSEAIPLLKPQNPEDVLKFHNKIKKLAIVAAQLHKKDWSDWKNSIGFNPIWSQMREKASLLLNLINFYEIVDAKTILTLDNEVKEYPLSDLLFFIKHNFYTREDILFYLLLGELLTEENFITFQLAIIYDKINAQAPLE